LAFRQISALRIRFPLVNATLLTRRFVPQNGFTESKGATIMTSTATNAALQALPVYFTFNVPAQSIPAGHILVNAPRPLFGKQVGLDSLNHGRYYALIDLNDEYSSDLLLRNQYLDARIVIPASKDELVDLVLLNNKYADRYRALETEDLFSEVSHLIEKIQGLPYQTASGMLTQIKQCLTAA
jgi:hypothetical protein